MSITDPEAVPNGPRVVPLDEVLGEFPFEEKLAFWTLAHVLLGEDDLAPTLPVTGVTAEDLEKHSLIKVSRAGGEDEPGETVYVDLRQFRNIPRPESETA